MARRAVLLVPAGAVLFTVAWVVLGALSPGYPLFGVWIGPYSAISQPISGLGLGATGPWMNAAFVISGLLVLVGCVPTVSSWWARGPAGRTAIMLLPMLGIGLVLDGVFTLQAVLPHLLGFVLAVPLPAAGLIAAGWSLRRTAPRVSAASLVAGVVSLLLFAAFMATFDPAEAGADEGVAGAIQRALVLVLMGCHALVLVHAAPSRAPVTIEHGV